MKPRGGVSLVIPYRTIVWHTVKFYSNFNPSTPTLYHPKPYTLNPKPLLQELVAPVGRLRGEGEDERPGFEDMGDSGFRGLGV